MSHLPTQIVMTSHMLIETMIPEILILMTNQRKKLEDRGVDDDISGDE